MIQFIYQLPDDIDPRKLHRDFYRMGVRESNYDYLPKERLWRLTVDDCDQAFKAETVLKIHRIPFDARVVASRLG